MTVGWFIGPIKKWWFWGWLWMAYGGLHGFTTCFLQFLLGLPHDLELKIKKIESNLIQPYPISSNLIYWIWSSHLPSHLINLIESNLISCHLYVVYPIPSIHVYLFWLYKCSTNNLCSLFLSKQEKQQCMSSIFLSSYINLSTIQFFI